MPFFRCTMLLLMITLISACETTSPTVEVVPSTNPLDYFDWSNDAQTETQTLLKKYTPFQLTTDLSNLTEKQRKMIGILIDAAEMMNDMFWYDAHGDKKALLEGIEDDGLKAYALVNYGPWDRLNGNASFVPGVGAKPAGANFYPTDMTKEEFEGAEIADKTSLYTYIRRDDKGALVSVPYHKQFEKELEKVSGLLLEAAELSEDESLKKYLTLRADALLTDEYRASDMAWLDMKTNQIDIVIGPIENYEDQLYGYKAAHEGYVLVKDMEWSKRLEKYATFLPELQRGLPVAAEYKKEEPGTDTELNAYDVIYYAGDCNSGSKTIAINLPNDEEVQLAKGTRRLQLKNAMRAKFDKILTPIADMLVDESQRDHITFDAFFANTMFHEVAHGLGIKNTINGKGTVRTALKENASALEEGKADMLGLYMIKQLHEQGEIEGDLKDYYVTFMTSIFRSVRFGASSAHGKANMIRFNFFNERGAFEQDAETGRFKVNFENFEQAMDELSQLILTLQGDGDYDGVATLVDEKAKIGSSLKNDLDRLADAGIPVDIIFEQGKEVLGL